MKTDGMMAGLGLGENANMANSVPIKALVNTNVITSTR